jgi:hypothetical protein
MRVCAHKTLSNENGNAALLYSMYVSLSYGKTFMTVVKIRFENSTWLDILNINIFTVITCYQSCCIKKYYIYVVFFTLLCKQMCNALWVECALQWHCSLTSKLPYIHFHSCPILSVMWIVKPVIFEKLQWSLEYTLKQKLSIMLYFLLQLLSSNIKLLECYSNQ